MIIVSVLLALAADAWWDGRVDRAEEVRRLAAVRLELAEARESYGELLETITERSERIAEVLADSTGFEKRVK